MRGEKELLEGWGWDSLYATETAVLSNRTKNFQNPKQKQNPTTIHIGN